MSNLSLETTCRAYGAWVLIACTLLLAGCNGSNRNAPASADESWCGKRGYLYEIRSRRVCAEYNTGTLYAPRVPQ